MDSPTEMQSVNCVEQAPTCGTQSGSALVCKGVGRTLFGMAFPLLAGALAMSAYNLTDTWFVSRLGTLPLAANHADEAQLQVPFQSHGQEDRGTMGGGPCD